MNCNSSNWVSQCTLTSPVRNEIWFSCTVSKSATASPHIGTGCPILTFILSTEAFGSIMLLNNNGASSRLFTIQFMVQIPFHLLNNCNLLPCCKLLYFQCHGHSLFKNHFYKIIIIAFSTKTMHSKTMLTFSKVNA